MHNLWSQIRRKYPEWGLFFPAGKPKEEDLQKGIDNIRNLGIGLKRMENISLSGPILALHETELIAEWKYFAADSDLPFLVSARGGVGSVRLASLLKKNILSPVPATLIGFSDLTALFWQLFEKYNKISIYGPVVTYHFARFEEWETAEQFAGILLGDTRVHLHGAQVISNPSEKRKIEGTLIPACFSVLAEVLTESTSDEPLIFILEDVNEKVYQLIRYLYLLEYKGYLNRCEGIILGTFSGTKNIRDFHREVQKLAEKYNFVVLKDLSFGHHLQSLALPFGVEGSVDLRNMELNWQPFLA